MLTGRSSLPEGTANDYDFTTRARRLQRALEEIDFPPCSNGCPWFERCRDEQLACPAFARYVKTGGRVRMPGERPTRERYARLFQY